ncbi:hypothetical protein PV08_07804 [Exophiala spinifera]|uniref:Transcription factor domain-containing protein n=1 Tax=Exophiala spinifera TaxID=91928 RepID=A0A0D1ZQI2_9EURO|nr:uncharacterized protein PV08_07804 [Exophiala spinifera]KIW15017.1 hypothetical protein PV08_07804 [Exophiala spinifera]
MAGLANIENARPVAYPLTPALDTRHDPDPAMHWGHGHNYSRMMAPNLSTTQPGVVMELPLIPLQSTKQHWVEPQRAAVPTIPQNYSYSSLASLDVAGAQYVEPQLASSDVNISSVSMPATPLQRNRTVSGSPLAPKLPSNEELSHLCKFFIMNLLVHIPILTEADVGDFDDMIKHNKRQLAYSMAYVAARFVPGCQPIRAMLVPELLSMLRIRFDPSGRDDAECWTLLQAFAVLCTWATPHNIHVPAAGGEDWELELRQDTLRASLEMMATACSVHRSGEEVIRLLKHERRSDVPQLLVFRKYCYWLWMFSTAQFQSLLLRTPPTIREDATIRWANQHLEQYTNDECTRRILADVSLALLWDISALNDRSLAEWWCSIPIETDVNSALALLTTLDDGLNQWRRRWIRPTQPHQQHQHSSDFASDPARSSCIDLYQRFSRFCISTHANKLFQSSATAENLPLSVVSLVTQSVERASTLCHLFLELTPLVKSSIRFAPESTFAMVAFACEWVIRAKCLFPGMECVRPQDLNVVRGVAELMIDLGVDNKHSARIVGESVLARLHAAMKSDSRSSPWTPAHQDPPWATPTSNVGSRSLIESVTAMDEIWPLRSPSIQRPQSNGTNLGLAISSTEGHDVFSASYPPGAEYFQYDPTWSI